MASREHSFVRASLPPVDAGEVDAGGEGGSAFTGRAVLGAAIAVSVAAGVGGSESARPSPPTASRRAPPLPRKAGEVKWRDALAAYREADAARAKFEVATSAASAGPGGRSFDEQEALDDEYGVFVDAADSAMLRLLEAPAPDLEALVVKISLISAHLVWENEGGEDCLVWVEADARRLAEYQTGCACSRTKSMNSVSVIAPVMRSTTRSASSSASGAVSS